MGDTLTASVPGRSIRPNGSSASSSSGASSASTTTPKLKLTFKLSEIRAASPAAAATYNNPPITETKNVYKVENVPEKQLKKKRIIKKERMTMMKSAISSVGQDTSTFVTPYKRAKATTTDASNIDHAVVLGASTRVQFPEQQEFVQEMQKFRARKWRLEPANLALLGKYSLSLPCWSRDKTANASNAAIRSLLNSGSQKSLSKSTKFKGFHPTFVCAHEGCHKIFDTKDKWRRHQITHKRRAQRTAAEAASSSGLQLKLDMGVIKKASANANISTIADHELASSAVTSPIISSFPDEDLTSEITVTTEQVDDDNDKDDNDGDNGNDNDNDALYTELDV